MERAGPGRTVDVSCPRGMVGEGKGLVRGLVVVSRKKAGPRWRGGGAAANKG